MTKAGRIQRNPPGRRRARRLGRPPPRTTGASRSDPVSRSVTVMSASIRSFDYDLLRADLAGDGRRLLVVGDVLDRLVHRGVEHLLDGDDDRVERLLGGLPLAGLGG